MDFPGCLHDAGALLDDPLDHSFAHFELHVDPKLADFTLFLDPSFANLKTQLDPSFAGFEPPLDLGYDRFYVPKRPKPAPGLLGVSADLNP